MNGTILLKNLGNFAIRCFREGSSQEDYFSKVIRHIDRTQKQILIEGYDAPFMDRELTVDALQRAIDRSVDIYAIVTDGLDTVLQELTDKHESVKMIKTPEPLVKGYISFDNHGLDFWDSEKPTDYAPERSDPHHARWPVERSDVYQRTPYEAIEEDRELPHNITFQRIFKETAEKLTDGQFQDRLLIDVSEEPAYRDVIISNTKFLAQEYEKKFDNEWKEANATLK